MTKERRLEICGVCVLACAILLFLALVSDGYHGDIRRPLGEFTSAPNLLGIPGAFVAGVSAAAVGRAAHLIYCVLGVWAFMLLRHTSLDRLGSRAGGAFMLVAGGALLLNVHGPAVFHPLADAPGGAVLSNAYPAPLGGILGGFTGHLLVPFVGAAGATVVGGTLALVGLLLATDLLLVETLRAARRSASRAAAAIWRGILAAMRPLGRAVRSVAWRASASSQAPETAPGIDTAPDTAHELDHAPPWSDGEDAPVEDAPAPEPVARADIQLNLEPPALDGVDSDEMPFALDEQAWDDAACENEVPASAAPESGAAATSVDGLRARLRQQHDELQELRDRLLTGDASDGPASGAGEDDAPDFELVADGGGSVPHDDILDAEAAADEALPWDLMPEPSAPAGTAEEPGPRKKPMPRRKSLGEDALPADYEYPKRFTKPSLDLFEPPPKRMTPDLSDHLLRVSARLEETLKTFGIDARVVEVTRGPTITRYELEPAPGIKVARFVSLCDDLALALKAHRVRVEAPIPGKGRVGIEVPNKHREPVVVRELLESKPFQKSGGRLNLAVGKDIAGDVTVADLAAMPHLLVAGATGAGKTVCVKTMLASLLCTHSPEELQVLLVDPKMVELSIFADIPHLITPVVTDPKQAASSLRWLISEMEERYRLFSHLRVRNIDVYNESVENGEIEMPDESGETVDVVRKLPYIVCVIDELADLMMLARADVEDAIARLAQLARAVGIHLIIATQRPSVDVLTGVIKANFPARMSFQVSSKVDSRCILDRMGAERLIGQGDMLYLPAGQSKPTRIQGAFVSDEEMNRLIAYLKTQAPPQYRDEIEHFGKDGEALETFDEENDELFEDAVRVVLETGQASISMVQRRLRVGYTRAARLIDMMEMRGIVGPHVGSKAREILVDVSSRNEVA
jgi:DNA segregation ATPase FtsK/SpoIIIE-like protein